MPAAAGHILDVFFQRSPLDRKRIVATKAATHVSGHVYWVLYFGSFAATFDATIAPWEYLAAIGLSLAGTSLAGAVLTRMTDGAFRTWSHRVTLGVCVTYPARCLAGGGALRQPAFRAW